MTATSEEAKARRREYGRNRLRRMHNIPPERFKVVAQTFNGEGQLTSEKRVHPGRDDADVTHLPDPAFVARTSTLYGADGEVRAQWVIEKPEDQERYAKLTAWAEQMAAELPPRPTILRPMHPFNDDLCVVYPVGDHHTGMLAWKHETGESFDIDIAEDILGRAVEQLVASAPPAGQAIIPFLGDFFHYDSFDSVTPTHRNLLDSDGRAPKMISAGMRMMETMIELAAAKHERVRVIVELGNHDAYTSMIAARWLDRIYRDNPRITVDVNPSHFHYFEWGQNLLGTHHGHGRVAKPAQLPGIMAHDQREAWGRTRYHYWHTGHVHHQSLYEYPGCTIETHRILAPADAYAFNEGYRGGREMKAITLHHEFGEVGRQGVNPLMLVRA